MTSIRRTLVAAATAAAVVAATLAATTLMPTGTAQAETNGGVRVMPLGDSITDGLTVPGGYRINLWQKLVAGGYTVDFVGSLFNGPSNLGDHDHEGHSGWRIDQIDSNITTWLRTYTPRTILLHIGTNDMIQNASGAPSRLATLIDHITTAAPDAEVFVATIIPLSGQDTNVRAFNSQIPGIVQTRAAAGRHVHLVDMYPALTTADLADGVHPNAGGYAKMATVWYAALQSVPGSLTPVGSSSSSRSSSSSSRSSSSSSRSSSSSSRSSSSSSSSGGTTGACRVTYTMNTWNTGFTTAITIANTGTSAINGWSLVFTLPGGQTITSGWNATYSPTSGQVTARNVSYNGAIAPSGSTSIGFQASHTGDTARPSSFTLNGSACSVG